MIHSVTMSPSTTAILLLFLTLIWSLITKALRKQKHQNLPPGPSALPVIGNLHMLGDLPHRSIHDLSKKFGHIMSLRLGNVPVIIVSSPKAAELFLKTHDTNFASRPLLQASKHMTYGSPGFLFAEYGPYWRHVRKLCTLQLLCPSRLEASAPLRKEQIGLLVQSLREAARGDVVVDLSEKVYDVSEDMTYKMVLGCTKEDDRFGLKEILVEAMCLAGAFNIADYVPFLGLFDFQGLTKRLKKVGKKMDQLMEKIIEEHEQVAKTKKQASKDDDFVDVLLSLENQPLNPNDKQVYILNRTNVKAIILDMITAAFDTSATSIIWGLAELMRHPRIMKKLQEELQSVVGMDRMVEESDLPKLDYLNMVVKESFRLHPIAPLLVPHESIDDITIEGNDIPKKSRIMVNIWTIGRDPNVWSENVEEFYPERFMNNNIDLRGHDFQLLPFGSGRRGCPGMQIGLTTVRLVLAQLVHCFDWELPNGMLPQYLDMTEKFSLSTSKAIHLLAKPIYRLSLV